MCAAIGVFSPPLCRLVYHSEASMSKDLCRSCADFAFRLRFPPIPAHGMSDGIVARKPPRSGEPAGGGRHSITHRKSGGNIATNKCRPSVAPDTQYIALFITHSLVAKYAPCQVMSVQIEAQMVHTGRVRRCIPGHGLRASGDVAVIQDFNSRAEGVP